MYRKKTILFVDEIHRFNKGQQDYLLPFVEDGTIILIGATTENPYFEVNGALISRSSIFELRPLEKEDIKTLIKRAVYDKEKGMGSYGAKIDEDAMEFLADVSRREWSVMTKQEIIIMIQYPLLLKVCGDPIRMLQFIIWQKCCGQEKILSLLHEGS